MSSRKSSGHLNRKSEFVEISFFVDGKVFVYPVPRENVTGRKVVQKSRVIEIDVPIDLECEARTRKKADGVGDTKAKELSRVSEERSLEENGSSHHGSHHSSHHSTDSDEAEQAQTLSRNQKIKLAESGIDLNVQEDCDEGDSEDNISLFARFKVKGKKGVVKCIPITINPESSVLQLKSLFAEQLGDECPITSLKFYHVSYKNATKFGVGDIRTADGKVGRLLDPFHDKKMISTMNIADGDFFEIEMK